MRLRQKSVQRIEDVQWASIEPNGEIGYALKEHKQFATKEDIQMILDLLHVKIPEPPLRKQAIKGEKGTNIFKELKDNNENRNNRDELK